MKPLLPALAFLLCLACVSVVVNVYFPESEAKGALASLEDELLKGMPAQPVAPKVPDAGGGQSPNPSSKQALASPLAVRAAHAAGPVTEEDIRAKIQGIPEVLEAYERIRARMSRVDSLRDQGLAGEGNDGLLHPRGEIADRRDQRTLDDENADRSTVIEGLAKATLLAQGAQATEANLQRVLPAAADTFAQLRREKARAGWWIQGEDGSWKKK